MSNGFKDYSGLSKKPSAAGGFLPQLGIAAIGAIATYFSTKSQIGSQEKGWQFQLELERMRIEAQKELDRERRTLDPAVYAMVKKELLRPNAPHGMGAGRSQTGAFREMIEDSQPRSQPTAIPMGGGGGQGFDLNKYLTGGGR